MKSARPLGFVKRGIVEGFDDGEGGFVQSHNCNPVFVFEREIATRIIEPSDQPDTCGQKLVDYPAGSIGGVAESGYPAAWLRPVLAVKPHAINKAEVFPKRTRSVSPCYLFRGSRFVVEYSHT